MVLIVDLDGHVPDILDPPHTQALVLVRRSRRPFAEVVVHLGDGLASEAFRAAIDRELEEVGTDVHAAALPARRSREALPRITVVITTCGNPGPLVRCVDSVLASVDVNIEAVVVDNRPLDERTKRVVLEHYRDEPRVRLVSEERQGLSRARNTGIGAATTDVVAWTDDDVVVDGLWARSLAEAFDDAEDVALVTGIVRPLALETEAQLWRERVRGYARVLEPRVWRVADPPPNEPLFPYASGRIGTGANMAVKRDAMLALGGFDPHLGAGTPAAGGEDLDLVFRVLDAGWTVVYEPAAIVSHEHHPTIDALAKQTRDYGTGLASYITKLLLSDPRRLADMVRRAPAAAAHLHALRSGNSGESVSDPALAARLRRAETVGIVIGVRRALRRRSSSSF